MKPTYVVELQQRRKALVRELKNLDRALVLVGAEPKTRRRRVSKVARKAKAKTSPEPEPESRPKRKAAAPKKLSRIEQRRQEREREKNKDAGAAPAED